MNIEPDFSYTITNEQLRMAEMPVRHLGDLFPYYEEQLLQRTERETETRRERFDRISVGCSPNLDGYRVHVWMKPREKES